MTRKEEEEEEEEEVEEEEDDDKYDKGLEDAGSEQTSAESKEVKKRKVVV